MSIPVLGGWTSFDFTISAEAKSVFAAAMEGFVGVSYTPLAVATQVVAGTNYCFLCKAEFITLPIQQGLALVYIFQPLEGKKPHIYGIVPITPTHS